MNSITILSRIKIVILYAIVIAVAGYVIFLPLACYVYLLFVPPVEDFFNNKPITSDFDFTKMGYSTEFKFRTFFWSSFEVRMECTGPYFTKEYDFQGRILMEIYSKNQLIQKQELDSLGRKYYLGKDMEHYSGLSLKDFYIPLRYRFNRDLTIKLTVLEPDKELEKFKNVKIKISSNI